MRKRTRKTRRARPGAAAGLQLAAFGLGLKMLETTAHAADVIARRGSMLGTALAQPAKLADPEFVRMVAEKAEAANEAWLRAVRHLGRPVPAGPMRMAASGLKLAESCLDPYRRRVRANAKRLGRR